MTKMEPMEQETMGRRLLQDGESRVSKGNVEGWGRESMVWVPLKVSGYGGE